MALDGCHGDATPVRLYPMVAAPRQTPQDSCWAWEVIRTEDLLADEKHIDCAEIEVVEEGEGSEAVIGRVLAGIELDTGHSCQTKPHQRVGAAATHHDCFPLVLDDVA